MNVCSQSPSLHTLPLAKSRSHGEWRSVWANLRDRNGLAVGRCTWCHGGGLSSRWKGAALGWQGILYEAQGFPFQSASIFFSCMGKGFQSIGLYPEMESQLINSTSGKSVHPTLSQNQQSLCSALCCSEMRTAFLSCANVPPRAV